MTAVGAVALSEVGDAEDDAADCLGGHGEAFEHRANVAIGVSVLRAEQ